MKLRYPLKLPLLEVADLPSLGTNLYRNWVGIIGRPSFEP
jgi:hypothetical protein